MKMEATPKNGTRNGGKPGEESRAAKPEERENQRR